MNAVLVKKSSIDQLERAILAAPQVDLHTCHHFSGGMYARTIHLAAGTVLTGATHKTDHINIVCGDISVTTDQGMQRLTGYHVIETRAGMKRAGFAHGPTSWTTVCKTDCTDVEKAENDLVHEAGQLQTRHPLISGNTTQQLKE